MSIWYRSPDITSHFNQQLDIDKPTEVVINDHYCSSDGELLYWVGLSMYQANENWCVRIRGWNIESVFMMLVSAVFGGGAGYLLAKWFGIGL